MYGNYDPGTAGGPDGPHDQDAQQRFDHLIEADQRMLICCIGWWMRATAAVAISGS